MLDFLDSILISKFVNPILQQHLSDYQKLLLKKGRETVY